MSRPGQRKRPVVDSGTSLRTALFSRPKWNVLSSKKVFRYRTQRTLWRDESIENYVFTLRAGLGGQTVINACAINARACRQKIALCLFWWYFRHLKTWETIREMFLMYGDDAASVAAAVILLQNIRVSSAFWLKVIKLTRKKIIE